MPTCVQCGGEEFVEDSGHFYCQVCQFQSQDVRVEETEFEGVPTNITVTKAPQPKKTPVTEKIDEEDKISRLGRPWTIQEGYQCVLKKQVQKLIELGASKELDEIVFRLWSCYLSALNVAFCDKEHLIPLTDHLLARPREVFCGSLENPIVKNKRNVKNRAPSRRQIEELEVSRQLDDEEFYEEDKPTPDTIAIARNSKSDPTMLRPTKNNVKHRIDWFILADTLNFLYLGLLFTNNHVTPSELISLAEKDIIPYLSSINCLKEDMKISAYDYFLFNGSRVPTTRTLRKKTKALMNFLGIYELPPLPLDIIVRKLLLKLDLPGELNGIINKFIEQLDVNLEVDPEFYVKDMECFAACLIIIILKLYFGINDSREHYLTECAKKLMTLFPDENLFIWEDWQCHMSTKYRIKQRVVNNNNPEPISDIDEFVKFYHSSIKNKNIGPRIEQRRKRFEPFLDGISELSKKAKESEQTEDHFVERENPLDILFDNDRDRSPSETTSHKLKSSSIKYLRPPKHSNAYDTNDESDSTVRSFTSESESEPNIPVSQKKLKKRKRKERKRQNAELNSMWNNIEGLAQDEFEEFKIILQDVQKTSGQYSTYNVPRPLLSENAVRDKYILQRHLSYEWLLSLFCKVIKCRVDDLEHMLKNLEGAAFEKEGVNVNFRPYYFIKRYVMSEKNRKKSKRVHPNEISDTDST